MTDDNVTNLDAWKVAKAIADYWVDCYSDNGEIYQKAQRRIDALRAVCPPDVWDEGLKIAHNHWEQP